MNVLKFTRSIALALVAWGSASSAVQAEFLVGLTTTNSLVRFDSVTPGVVSNAVAITGIGAGETIFDIDYRPANGLLYGFGSTGSLYAINAATGVATLSATLMGVTLNTNTTRVGIDFNPTVDRVRIVSNTGQDLRLTPGTSATTIDGNLNGAASSAVSVAYSNNVAGATTTTLFYIGSNSFNSLYNTTAPNDGTLSLVGSLGFTSTQDVGFDISGTTGIAYASLANPTGSGSSLYTVNLLTGSASLTGPIAGGLTLRGLTVVIPASVPEPASLAMLSIGLLSAVGYWRRNRNR